MNDSVTKADLDAALRTHTDEIVGVLQGFMLQVEERFTILEARVDNLDLKFDKLMQDDR